MARWVPIVVAASGCAASSREVGRTFDAAEVDRAVVDLHAGDLEVRAPGDRVVVRAELSARANGREEADRRAEAVRFEAEVEDRALVVSAEGPARTRADVEVEAPADLDLELRLADGTVTLEGTQGAQAIAARGVRGRGVHGSVRIDATSEGVDLELFPDGPCEVTARGSLVVSLPFGLPYDLVIRPDPSWGAEVTDLGFRDFVQTDQLVEGRAGDASLRVELRAVGGPVTVLEATP